MVVDGRGKLENKQIFYIIDTINEAINRHKKIRFRKIEYNVKKERVLHHGGEKYTFSPYSLVWDGDNYYVVGYSDKYENIGSHRVDRIAEQPEILDEPAVPPKASFSVEKYVKTTFRMYNAPRKEGGAALRQRRDGCDHRPIRAGCPHLRRRPAEFPGH
ncbi:MAG: WYL domain-containing protein [Oscillospiraceae bacterium]